MTYRQQHIYQYYVVLITTTTMTHTTTTHFQRHETTTTVTIIRFKFIFRNNNNNIIYISFPYHFFFVRPTLEHIFIYFTSRLIVNWGSVWYLSYLRNSRINKTSIVKFTVSIDKRSWRTWPTSLGDTHTSRDGGTSVSVAHQSARERRTNDLTTSCILFKLVIM